jgi:hypothetical protein
MFSFRNFSTHVGNTLLVDDTRYKSIFNDLWNGIFVESFEGASNNGDYLFSIVLPYLVSFHFFGFSVQTYMKHNPFGTIKSINQSDPYYKMLFEDCSDSCDTKTKLKKKSNIFTIILSISI